MAADGCETTLLTHYNRFVGSTEGQDPLISLRVFFDVLYPGYCDSLMTTPSISWMLPTRRRTPAIFVYSPYLLSD